MFVVALLGTFPGYWFTVFFIERLGRFIIQLIGFFMMSVFMFALVIKYDYFKDHVVLFALLCGLTFFFANFGPNSTTFVLHGRTHVEGKGGPGPPWAQKKNFLVCKIFKKRLGYP